MRTLLFSLCLLPGLALAASHHKASPAPAPDPVTTSNCVTLATSAGDITLQLAPEKAPVSVANFLHYVDKGFYNGTVFHRVIADFMVQAGGFDDHGNRKRTDAPIANESDNGLANDRGTIAMARTSDPDSATSQFFINLVNNAYLNYRPGASKGNGYAVFGKVIAGMNTVDKIGDSDTHVGSLDGYGAPNVPVTPILINTTARVACPAIARQ